MAAQGIAEVRLAGRTVGILEYDRGGSRFEYSDDLLAQDHQVLGQIFEDDPRTVRRARTGLPAWFANLLPEGELRRQVVREMGGGRIGDYRLLLRLGNDLPGAVTVVADDEPDDSDDLTADGTDPYGADHPLRYSLAGVQLKYSVRSERLTMPVSGEGRWWIVKLPDRTLPNLAENEFLTMRWLRASGFAAPPVECLPASVVSEMPPGFVAPDSLVYLIERFDRTPTGRVHVEDFAQVADVEPRFKYGSEFGATYDSVGRVVRYLTGIDGFLAYVDRLAAMVITGNTDAHLKNWALRYPDGRTPQLAPVYDFHSLTVYDRFRYAPLALSLAGEQMPNAVSLDHFRRLAEACDVDPDSTALRVQKTVEAMRESWGKEIGEEARRRFPPLADHYEQRLHSLPLTQADSRA